MTLRRVQNETKSRVATSKMQSSIAPTFSTQSIQSGHQGQPRRSLPLMGTDRVALWEGASKRHSDRCELPHHSARVRAAPAIYAQQAFKHRRIGTEPPVAEPILSIFQPSPARRTRRAFRAMQVE